MSFVAGLVISLSIELLQVYLPSRDSSLLDLIMNALGSVIGAIVGLTVSPHLIRNRCDRPQPELNWLRSRTRVLVGCCVKTSRSRRTAAA